MENRLMNTEKLRLARVKYYNVEKNGAELSEHDAYAFLYQIAEKKFVNPFDLLEDLPVLDRSFYANVMMPSGEYYGTKIVHVCGELQNGPCYVMEKMSVRSLFGRNFVTMEDLRNYILKSKKFFVDRIHIIEELKEPFYKKSRYLPIVLSDEKKMAAFKSYLQEHECDRVYKK